MKVFIIWLIGVILWNFGYSSASLLEDVLAAVILSFLSMYLKKYIKKLIILLKNRYFDNKIQNLV